MPIPHLPKSASLLDQILKRLSKIALKIEQSNGLENLLNVAVREVRALIKSDRVIIYQFLPNGDGMVAAESVGTRWLPIRGQLIYDPCLQRQWIAVYQQGRITQIDDVNSGTLAPCHQDLLTRLQVQANLVVPILLYKGTEKQQLETPQLWALLIVHHCRSPRQWQLLDIQILQNITLQLGMAIQKQGASQFFREEYQKSSDPKIAEEVINPTYNPVVVHKPQVNFSHPPITNSCLRQVTSTTELAGLDFLQNPVWIFDIQNLKMWWANPSALRIWNAASKTELQNRNFSDISEATRIRLQAYLHQFAQGKTVSENWTFYPENRPVSVHCLCSGIQIENQRLAMLVEGTTEVMEGIEQDTLRAIEAFRHTNLIISLYSLDGVPLMQNPAAMRCYGDCVHPNLTTENTFLRHFVNRSVGQEAIAAMQAGKVFSIETQMLTLQGIRWHGLDVRRTRDPVTGNPIMLVHERDITDRCETEMALRESEELYRSVVAAMAEGIVLQQADGQITACNARAEEILGLTQEQMMGRTSVDPRWRSIREDGSAFPGLEHPAMVTLHTGVAQANVIMGVHKPNGCLTWISINSQPLFDTGASSPYAVVTSFTDITDRKQAETALQQQTERERMLYAIAQKIRQSLDLEQILNTTVAEVRAFLQTDRAMIYRFDPDWSGVVVTESVATEWLSLLGMRICDHYFRETQGEAYQQGYIRVTSDIYTADFSPCHLNLLEQLQVRAKLVVPILQGNELWGLLVAHHCSEPRFWQPLEVELLQQLATQVAIAIQQSELYQQLQYANQELHQLACTDGLTQVSNRRRFDEALDLEWRRLMREQSPLSLILCDVDYFKPYNDTYGHLAGDEVLRQVAMAIAEVVKRPADLVARYGGEEFVILLPNTETQGAIAIATMIQEQIADLKISHEKSLTSAWVTLSLGIATMIPYRGSSPSELLAATDHGLYQAKLQGRNCIYVAREG